jgi:hypothetical protein
MTALLNDSAKVHHDDRIGVSNGGESVGNHKARPTFSKARHCFLNEDLGAGVDVARGFVKNQNALVGQERAGNGE